MIRHKSHFSPPSLPRTAPTSSTSPTRAAPKSPTSPLPKGLQQAIDGRSEFTSTRAPSSGVKPQAPVKPPKPPKLAGQPIRPNHPTTTEELMQGFRPPEVPFKSGNKPVIGTQTFRPPKADVPGTRYDLVAPMQPHVSSSIVQDKLDAWKQNPPGNIAVPVYKAPNTDKLTIAGDGHHSFVAAMKGGYPIDLNLVKFPGNGPASQHSSWQNSTYADFKKGDSWVF